MKEFDYIIIGGGCAGLSLAYELEIHNKLKHKTLAIIEPRIEYKRDKTWSFWKVVPHNFEDCVKKNWKEFSIKTPSDSKVIKCNNFPYQSIDSGLFYEKINDRLKKNKNIKFFKNIKDLNTRSSFVFNSLLSLQNIKSNLWQHFHGIEIETREECFNDSTLNLMDFDCDQRNNVHFFYVLPFSKNKAMIETTWLSKKDKSLEDYNSQIKSYLDHLGLKDYKIKFEEEGAIPLFHPLNEKEKNKINIGTAGGMTRLSTGYTFLNIQEHSKYIRMNIENIQNTKKYEVGKKYQFLDKIFLRVLEKHPEKMPNIFFKIFNENTDGAIKFLSNRSNFIDDLSVILKMPKWTFIKSLFN
ncbi:MAG: lycopene cyclase [Candidatus Marinimicrobia bacterium]|nr:lycopene cyclase [Candidatus Neomarinimicrobiota bacterium]RPG05393.1 MAG: lycopene cyclase [Pelagibacteraceae bacterium TMED247]|tara:strand:+ start:17358 stop:18419 length:1062 start_codon:yes stop_codon:yes gene_type:complete